MHWSVQKRNLMSGDIESHKGSKIIQDVLKAT